MGDATPCSECYGGDAVHDGLCDDCEIKRLRELVDRLETLMDESRQVMERYGVNYMPLIEYFVAKHSKKIAEEG